MKKTDGLKYISGYVKKNYDYIIIFIVYLIPHFFMSLDCWDDVFYVADKAVLQYSFWGFIERQYKYWTSRIVIEAAMYIFSYLPTIGWRIVDTFMIVLLYYSISKILDLYVKIDNQEKEFRFCRFLLFLGFPYALMATAGWLTTTINWTWTLALLLYGIKVLLYAVKGTYEVKYGVKNLMYCVAFIYATNFDVFSIVAFCLLGIIGFACYKAPEYKFNGVYWEAVVITLMNLVLFIVCPGNRVRMSQDALIHGTEEMLSLSVWGKLRMGINSTFYHFVSIPNVILVLACIILLVAVFLKQKKRFIRILACIPSGIIIGWTIYVFFAYTVKNRVLTYVYPDASYSVCPKSEQYLAIVSALTLLGVIVYLLKLLIEDIEVYWFLLVMIFVWGLLPEVILGFTTTISASILRVVSFFYFSLIGMSCVVIQRSGMLKQKIIYNGIIAIGGIGILMNFMQMIRHIIVYG